MTERHIYFIRPVGQLGPVKIGISARAKMRLVEMLEWSPLELELAFLIPGDYKLERQIHNALATDHIRREWFKASPRIIKLVADLQAGVPLHDAIDLSREEGAIQKTTNGRPRPPFRARRIDDKSGLTAGQLECLNFIKQFIEAHVRSPTYQEICDGLGLHSKSGVHRFILALEERGYISRTPGRRCTITVVGRDVLERAA